MSRPLIRIVDGPTGDYVERPMNDDEFASHQATVDEAAIKAQAIADRAAAVASARAKLAKLGLTDDEIAALLA